MRASKPLLLTIVVVGAVLLLLVPWQSGFNFHNKTLQVVSNSKQKGIKNKWKTGGETLVPDKFVVSFGAHPLTRKANPVFAKADETEHRYALALLTTTYNEDDPTWYWIRQLPLHGITPFIITDICQTDKVNCKNSMMRAKKDINISTTASGGGGGVVTVINVQAADSQAHGFQCSAYFGGRIPRVLALDKALYYFAHMSSKEYDFVWFLEDDVFVPTLQAFLQVHHEVLIKQSDLVTKSNMPRDDQKDPWWWKTIEKTMRLRRPWYRSNVMAFGASWKLLRAVNSYVRTYKRIDYLETFFNTLAMNHHLSIYNPVEFSSLNVGKDPPPLCGDLFEHSSNWYHPIKYKRAFFVQCLNSGNAKMRKYFESINPFWNETEVVKAAAANMSNGSNSRNNTRARGTVVHRNSSSSSSTTVNGSLPHVQPVQPLPPALVRPPPPVPPPLNLSVTPSITLSAADFVARGQREHNRRLRYPSFAQSDSSRNRVAVCILANNPNPSVLNLMSILTGEGTTASSSSSSSSSFSSSSSSSSFSSSSLFLQYQITPYLISMECNPNEKCGHSLQFVNSSGVRLINISMADTMENGFQCSMHCESRNRRVYVTDKALYYFSRMSPKEYDFVWFIQQEVYIPSMEAFLRVHQNALLQRSDLVTKTHTVRNMTQDPWKWSQLDRTMRLSYRPWYRSENVQAFGLSWRMLLEVSTYVSRNKRLDMLHSFLNTLAMQKQLRIWMPAEWNTIHNTTAAYTRTVAPYECHQILQQRLNWYYPVKDYDSLVQKCATTTQ